MQGADKLTNYLYENAAWRKYVLQEIIAVWEVKTFVRPASTRAVLGLINVEQTARSSFRKILPHAQSRLSRFER
jgi:hypothetical protein